MTEINYRISMNIWTAMVAFSVVSLIAVILSYSYYVQKLQTNYKQFQVLAAEMGQGCANPNNELATIQIGFNKNQVWSCTPFFKQNRAPKVPDGRKMVKR